MQARLIDAKGKPAESEGLNAFFFDAAAFAPLPEAVYSPYNPHNPHNRHNRPLHVPQLAYF